MHKLTLTIGDKNLSSWSLRPWLLMTHAGIAFTEENIRLDRLESRRILRERAPAGLVPFLTHDGVKIWDTLAIADYVSDLYPEKALWPIERHARGVARSVAAEMHSGFSALRTVWPMNFLRRGLKHLTTGGVRRDLDRIDAIWNECRAKYANGGDFLFGEFSIADAMYAPVVARIMTYGPVEMSDTALDYIEVISALPAMKAWGDSALIEVGG